MCDHNLIHRVPDRHDAHKKFPQMCQHGSSAGEGECICSSSRKLDAITVSILSSTYLLGAQEERSSAKKTSEGDWFRRMAEEADICLDEEVEEHFGLVRAKNTGDTCVTCRFCGAACVRHLLNACVSDQGKHRNLEAVNDKKRRMKNLRRQLKSMLPTLIMDR